MSRSSVVVLEDVEPGDVCCTPHIHGHHPHGKLSCKVKDLSSEEEQLLQERAFAIARSLTSKVGAQEDDGKPRQGAIITVAIYRRPSHHDIEGTCRVWTTACAPPSSVIVARNKAYTAGMISYKHAAFSTKTFDILSEPGKMFHNYADSVSSELGYAMSRVHGGLPIYRGGHCIGGIGVDGDTPEVCDSIARATLVHALEKEVLMAPPRIQGGTTGAEF